MSNRFTWMHSGQIGAPQMNGASGSNGQMLQILDACLINGFNTQTVSSVSKTTNTATLSYSVSHGYVDRQKVLISGATDQNLNGTHNILSKTENSITVDAIGVSVTTGSITTKVAPLGFESIFGSTDPLKRAYRSKDIQSTQTVLYLDMTLPAGHGYNATNPTKRAMVSMCEDMTELGAQINSYTDEKNNFALNPNGSLFWYQCRNRNKTDSITDTQNGSWIVVGDGKFFYFFQDWFVSNLKLSRSLKDNYAFGDVDSLVANDVFNCIWLGSTNANDTTGVYFAGNGSKVDGSPTAATQVTGYFIKKETGVGGLDPLVISTGVQRNFISSGYTGGIPFPNEPTNSIVTMPLVLVTTGGVRALAQGLRYIPQALGNDFQDYNAKVFDNTVVSSFNYAIGNSGLHGYFAVDLT